MTPKCTRATHERATLAARRRPRNFSSVRRCSHLRVISIFSFSCPAPVSLPIDLYFSAVLCIQGGCSARDLQDSMGHSRPALRRLFPALCSPQASEIGTALRQRDPVPTPLLARTPAQSRGPCAREPRPPHGGAHRARTMPGEAARQEWLRARQQGPRDTDFYRAAINKC